VNHLLYTTAIIDSSSSLTYIPRAAATAIFTAIPGSALQQGVTANLDGAEVPVDVWSWPCSTKLEPGFVFSLGRRQAISFESQYVSDQLGKTGICTSSIRGADIEQNGKKIGILGSASFFLSSPLPQRLRLTSFFLISSSPLPTSFNDLQTTSSAPTLPPSTKPTRSTETSPPSPSSTSPPMLRPTTRVSSGRGLLSRLLRPSTALLTSA
jgi:hypothetical protein